MICTPRFLIIQILNVLKFLQMKQRLPFWLLTCDHWLYISKTQRLNVTNTATAVCYIPINDTTFELSVFWPYDTESRINELRFSASLSFKTRLLSVTCFCGNVT